MARGWLIGGAAFLGVLLVVSIVVALLEREETLSEGSPEATVQQFLKAVEGEDFQIAYGFLSEELREDCSVQDFVGANARNGRLRNGRVTLERTQTVEDTTFVTVRITQFFGSGPFGTSESTFEQRFPLSQENGEWRFTQYPWPYFQCGPFKPERVIPAPTPPPVREPDPTPTPAS